MASIQIESAPVVRNNTEVKQNKKRGFSEVAYFYQVRLIPEHWNYVKKRDKDVQIYKKHRPFLWSQDMRQYAANEEEKVRIRKFID